MTVILAPADNFERRRKKARFAIILLAWLFGMFAIWVVSLITFPLEAVLVCFYGGLTSPKIIAIAGELKPPDIA